MMILAGSGSCLRLQDKHVKLYWPNQCMACSWKTTYWAWLCIVICEAQLSSQIVQSGAVFVQYISLYVELVINPDTSVYSGTPLFQPPEMSVYSGTPLFQLPEMRSPLYTVELPLFQPPEMSVYSGTPLFQHPEMRTPLYTVEPLYSNPLKWGHLCIQWNLSIPTPWNEDTSVYSGTPLFQPPETRTPLYTVEPLYSNPLKRGHHLYIQWNPSILTPWNEVTSVYSGTSLFQLPEMRTPLYTVEPSLFQLPEMRTPLYTVEPLYSNPLKWGHLCIQWNPSIPTPWNEDTSVYSGTSLF